MTGEINMCSFCKEEKNVLRQYLHAKNKKIGSDGFEFIYYCNDCGLLEHVMTSQTPEEREIEEVVKEFYKIFDTDNLWQGEDEWTKNVPIGNIEQWLRTTLHHQLQKAREEERERIIYITKNIKDAFMSPLTERRWLQCIQFTDQPKPEDQSDPDQDKALQDNN